MTRRFSRPILAAIDESKVLGVRAGARSETSAGHVLVAVGLRGEET